MLFTKARRMEGIASNLESNVHVVDLRHSRDYLFPRIETEIRFSSKHHRQNRKAQSDVSS